MNIQNLPATIGHNNPPSAHYDAAMQAAKRVGDNFGTLAKNMRLMVVDLVRAACVEDYSLQSAITAAKKKMRYDKLEAKDQKTAANNFTYARTIAGAWRDLSAEVQAQFIDGKVTPSTLSKSIKDAEKAEVEASSAEGETEAAMEERAETVAKGGKAETKAQAETLDVGKSLAIVTAFVKSLRQQGLQMATEAELVALHHLSIEIDDFRADMAKPAKVIGQN